MARKKKSPPPAAPVLAATRRFTEAIRRIEAANAADPATLTARGKTRPKALAEGAMALSWVARLYPAATEALRLAALAHHLRRWEIPRASHPEGRTGYLRWRKAVRALHAREVGAILEDVGYDACFIARVQDIVRKKDLAEDGEVQALEDAICLVFLETELASLQARMDAEKLASVLRKTWGKMSPPAREAALALRLSPEARALVLRAVRDD